MAAPTEMMDSIYSTGWDPESLISWPAVASFVGLFACVGWQGALLGRARAACDVAGLQACDSDHTAAERLQLLRPNGTLSNAFLDVSCRIWHPYLQCAETKAIDTCSLEDSAAIYLSIKNLAGKYCNNGQCCSREGTCQLQAFPCIEKEPALFQAWREGANSRIPNSSFCQPNLRFRNCYAMVDRKCKALEEMNSNLAFGTETLYRICEEDKCDVLSSCKATFATENGPILDRFNCSAWRKYVTCSWGAVSACPTIAPASEAPSRTQMASTADEVCTLITATSRLDSCLRFQACARENLQYNTPHFFCRILERVTRCAADLASPCDLLNAADVMEQANRLSVKTANMGCGHPYINTTGSCPELDKCLLNLQEALQLQSFVDICRAAGTYMSCADSAARGCNSASVLAAVNAAPRLDTLSDIAGRVCTEINDKELTKCQMHFSTCIDGYLGPNSVSAIPRTDGDRVFGLNWCPILTRTLECVTFYEDQCPLSASLKATLQGAYSDLLASGCPDEYNYLKKSTGAGARSAAAVSVWTVFIISLVPVLRLH